MRWVLVWKKKAGGSVSGKGRLVILGYQHSDLVRLNAAVPAISRFGKHLFFSQAALHNFIFESANAPSAFPPSSVSLEPQELYA